MSTKPDLEPDYTLQEVADALRMSTRWVRDQIKAGAECTRRGRKIRFTRAQVEKLRASYVQTLVNEPVTTGRKRTT